jgi:hypothetical protein
MAEDKLLAMRAVALACVRRRRQQTRQDCIDLTAESQSDSDCEDVTPAHGSVTPGGALDLATSPSISKSLAPVHHVPDSSSHPQETALHHQDTSQSCISASHNFLVNNSPVHTAPTQVSCYVLSRPPPPPCSFTPFLFQAPSSLAPSHFSTVPLQQHLCHDASVHFAFCPPLQAATVSSVSSFSSSSSASLTVSVPPRRTRWDQPSLNINHESRKRKAQEISCTESRLFFEISYLLAMQPDVQDIKHVLFVDLDNWQGFFKFIPNGFNFGSRVLVEVLFGQNTRPRVPVDSAPIRDLLQFRHLHFTACGSHHDAADIGTMARMATLHCEMMSDLSVGFTIITGDRGLCMPRNITRADAARSELRLFSIAHEAMMVCSHLVSRLLTSFLTFCCL